MIDNEEKSGEDHRRYPILRICTEATGKTKIVYQCNLNFHTVNIHLQRLINASLLKSSGSEDNPSYRTTAKGIEVLGHINVLRDLLTAVPGSQGRLVVPEGQEDQEQ